jgi:hypothetical protein
MDPLESSSGALSDDIIGFLFCFLRGENMLYQNLFAKCPPVLIPQNGL